MHKRFNQLSPRVILAGTAIASLLPFLMVMLFPGQLHFVMDGVSYLLFHNTAEFFSIMVSLSIFGVGWHTYSQSRDRHALFLSAAFLSIGLMDFIHTLASAAMPAFVTPNSTNKSAQFWIAARLLSAVAFLCSAYIQKEGQNGWLKKAVFSRTTLMMAAIVIPAVVFAGVTFYPSRVPDAFVPGTGLTSFKVYTEYLIVFLLCLAAAAYWKRMVRSGDKLLLYYVTAFIVCAASELVFTAYKIDFDIHNVLGHTYKVVAFYLIYRGIFVSSVRNPYAALTDTNARLDKEIIGHTQAKEALQRAYGELEERVEERTTALRKSEQRWSTTLSSIGDAVIATDVSGIITFMNQVAETLTGWALAEAVSKPVSEVFRIVNERTREEVESPVAKVLREGMVVGLANHTILVKKDGTEVPIDDSGAPIRDKDGTTMGVVLVFRDIAERRLAEEALRESRVQLNLAVKSASMGVWHWDLVEGRRSFDEQACRLLGIEPATFTGRADEFFGAVHPDDREMLKAALTGTIEQDVPYEPEYRAVWPDGSVHYIAARGRLVRYDTDNRAERINGVIWDITNRKRTEEELRKAHDELEKRIEERTAELRQAYYRLMDETREREKVESQLRQAQKLEALGTLSGGIAHDFNNILAAIIGFTELVADHITEGSRGERHVQRIMEASIRGRELVRQMLTFSRKTEQEKKPLLLSDIVKETVKLIRATTPTTIDVRVKVQSESALILGDPTQMQQVLMNLCTNAAHAMRENGGALGIELSDFNVSGSGGNFQSVEPGPYMKLIVRDTGTGILPDVIDRVFDPFFTTKKLGEGTGLGLSVVHGIIKQSNGYITVESEPGKGSTFTVYLPGVVGETETDAASEDVLPTGTERVLFIDDEAALVEMGEDILAALGYDVTSRTSSKKALSLLREDPHRFDLVITDQTMPDITGIELAKEILSFRADMPIIMCTGFSHLVDAEKARGAGIKAFAMKPLTKREIARTVRQVLDE
jgi:PAS domain S-box-containing protein